jgi:hypothetical protein
MEIYFAGLQELPQRAVHPQHHHQAQHQSLGQPQDSDMCDIYIGGNPEGDNMVNERKQHGEREGGGEPSLTFFATICAMLAVGASALESCASSPSHPDYSNASHGSPSNSSTAGPTTPPMSSSSSSSIIGPSSALDGTPPFSHAFFYALSQQAMGVWDTHVSSSGNGEREGEGVREREGMDYILACVTGVGYLMSRIRLTSSAGEDLEGEKEKRHRDGVCTLVSPFLSSPFQSYVSVCSQFMDYPSFLPHLGCLIGWQNGQRSSCDGAWTRRPHSSYIRSETRQTRPWKTI